MELTEIQREIEKSLTNGFVDQDQLGSEQLVPQFIYNAQGDKMLDHIERELDHCSSFIFAIAFVTESALTALKVKLSDLAAKGIGGRILTSSYLNFNSPKVFKEMQKLNNVSVRIANEPNFHAKGYIFEHEGENYQSVFIGSSNLTSNALMMNYEWNIKFTSYDSGAITQKIINEVENSWASAHPLTSKWITEYDNSYEPIKKQVSTEKTTEIKPNSMQSEALTKLQLVRQSGEERALVISATGTGKTFLGALDVANFKPKRFLYIVHREQILDKTMDSFRKVLSEEPENQFGKISGSTKDLNAKYLFATIQTLSKNEWLQKLDPKEFDYILVDEAHRAGAKRYQKVLSYFKPKFLLGMTATPERMDDFNLYEMFNYQIAYEIRLQRALDEQMLCPFHYIGITDYERNGKMTSDTSQLKWLVSEERVTYILKQTEYYGYSGDVLQGLIFCSRKDEAYELATILTSAGHPSKALTGADSQSKRDQIVAELEAKKIEYIITVDVFNEGIDIPCVNQVVMLRNTQSSIVFVQQLGRGLRKSPNKDYVTVIDFIGNYKNNYLIPIALTGDKTRSKNNARDDLETRQISGVSTVSFSEIAKERIYESITNTKLDSLKILRDDYQNLKNRLGRPPLLVDFQEMGAVDCMVFGQNYNNYYQFLIKMKEDFHITADENAVLSFVSMELMNGKRIVELRLLDELLMAEKDVSKQAFKSEMQNEGIYFTPQTEDSISNVLSLEFFKPEARKKYGGQFIVSTDGGSYKLNTEIKKWFETNVDFRTLFLDALKAGLIQADQYQQTQQFTLYRRYTRKDVCRLLDWDSDRSSTVFGYQTIDNSCPIFVTYSKSDDVDESIKYPDRFLSTDTFQWYTRHYKNQNLNSKDVRPILAKQTTIQLFIQKAKKEEFYYFGEVTPISAEQEEFMIGDKDTQSIVKMILKLKKAALYDKFLLFEK